MILANRKFMHAVPEYKTIMKCNYYFEPQIRFRTYSFVILADFYTICHRTWCQQSHCACAAKKLIHITNLGVGTSTIPTHFSHAIDNATLKCFINSIITPMVAGHSQQYECCVLAFMAGVMVEQQSRGCLYCVTVVIDFLLTIFFYITYIPSSTTYYFEQQIKNLTLMF